MKFKSALILGIALLPGSEVAAQEFSRRFTPLAAESILDRPLKYLPERGIPFERTITWQSMLREEKARTEQQRYQVAQRSMTPIREYFQKPQQKVKFKLDIGNSAVKNWSPYPDRALDARVIRYPMPRSAAKAPRK